MRAPHLTFEFTDTPDAGRTLKLVFNDAPGPTPAVVADVPTPSDAEFTSEPFRTRVATMQAAASVLAGFALFLPPLVLSRGWPISNWRFLVPLLLSIFCGLLAVSSALDGRGFGRARELVGIMWSDAYTKRHVQKYGLARPFSTHDNVRAYRLAWSTFVLFLLTFATTMTVLAIDRPPAAPAPATGTAPGLTPAPTATPAAVPPPMPAVPAPPSGVDGATAGARDPGRGAPPSQSRAGQP